jgi:type III secretion system low calcium response chaperone LcrH/SycD
MPEKENFIFSSVKKMGASHREEVKTGIDALIGNFSKGMMPKDAFGVSPKTIEALYADAYQLYNIGKYEEAKRIFSTLLIADPIDARFPFGMAASCHMMKDYELAASLYFKTSMFDPDNPIPYYHASDCHLHADDPVSALASLRLTVKRCGDKPEYQMIKGRAQMTIDNLIKTHGKGGAKPESVGDNEGPHLNKK